MPRGAEKLSFDAYCDWHRETLGEDLLSQDLRRQFEANIVALLATANTHAVVQELSLKLQSAMDGGVLPGDFNGRPPELIFKSKSYDSVINKIYRINCLWNRQWNNESDKGWVKIANCYSKLDDLIRTLIVCNYIDGPEFLSKQFEEAANKLLVPSRYSSRSLSAGYYAWHFYYKNNADIFPSGKVEEVSFEIEIQLTSLLQYTLKGLTHRFYERRRTEISPHKSQWDYGSPEFRGTYLSHTLHLVDDVILDLRKKAEEADGKDRPIEK